MMAVRPGRGISTLIWLRQAPSTAMTKIANKQPSHAPTLKRRKDAFTLTSKILSHVLKMQHYFPKRMLSTKPLQGSQGWVQSKDWLLHWTPICQGLPTFFKVFSILCESTQHHQKQQWHLHQIVNLLTVDSNKALRSDGFPTWQTWPRSEWQLLCPQWSSWW